MLWLGWILFTFLLLWVVPAVCALFVKQLSAGNVTSAVQATLVSVIMPARNEAAKIEQSLVSILASRGIQLELIAVNDRSTDSTGSIMDCIAQTDARMQVIHIAELPEDWLGKNHAMHVAACRATGQFLLFTDGDVMYQPETIAVAVAHLRRHQLQHLCLMPCMERGGVLENAMVAFFGLAFAIGMQLSLVRTRWPLAYAGVGAFNLIDAEFYRRMGGHVPIKMDVIDDVKLGKMVKKNGGRQDFQAAPDLLSIRWQASLWGVVTGLEKNGFASLNYSLPLVFLCTLAFFSLMIFPYFAAVWLPWPAASGFVAILLLWHSAYAVAAVVSRGGWWLFPLFPFGATALAFAFWRSTWITLRNGGVRWRDSFYPLAKLRAAVYR